VATVGRTGKVVELGGKAMNTRKVCAAVLIAVLLLPNVAASAEAAKEAYEKGKSYLEERDCDAAIAAFTGAIRLDPKYADVYNSRGIACRHKGQYDRAIADYSEAIRLDPVEKLQQALPNCEIEW
jgi:tetratricopeptide (TPR) repeat protein